MQVFVQLLITGVAMGFIYALVGIEYTLIWNSTGLLNFSHDKFILFGAYMFARLLCIELRAPAGTGNPVHGPYHVPAWYGKRICHI